MIRQDWSHEANIKQYGVITAAVITGISAVYSVNEQKKAANKAAAEQERLRLEEEERMKEIADLTKPDEETATVEFGSDTDVEQSTYSDFLFQPTSSTLGSTTGSGLSETTADSNVTTLGF